MVPSLIRLRDNFTAFRAVLFGLVFLPLTALYSSCVSAELVKNLYEAQVPIADHSERELARASRVALSKVLVKVSGSVQVLNNPLIIEQLTRARSRVQQYSYTRDQDVEGDLAAKFEFDSSVVSAMVTDSGSPLWTANRPAVLVWIVTQNSDGRQFVNAGLSPEVIGVLQEGFAERGIPVRFPLYDLADSSSLSVDEAWRLKASPILTASQRYGVQDILAGRLTGLSTGKWVGDWSYFSENNRVERSVTVDLIEQFLGEGVSLVAEAMAARYAVSASGAVAGGVLMSVFGVKNYSDYASIVEWLESLELIQHANIESVRGDDIELRLTARADASALRTIIELNGRLVPLTPEFRSEELTYQWQN